jgi:hypothetical protein
MAPLNMLKRCLFSLYVLGAATWLLSDQLSAQDGKKIDFAHDIAPIIRARCLECHSGGKPKGELSLESRDLLLASDVATPGKSGKSELLARLTHADPKKRMPPKGDPLTDKQIAAFKRWIDEGLVWDAGFSFDKPTYTAPLKLGEGKLPPARDGRDHPIDRLVDAYFQAKQVEFPQPTSDAVFARRASLDLIGLLPDPEQVKTLEADTAPDKRERFVRMLLDDRRAYADHWLSFWNDLLRNDYRGTGYIDGGRKQISAWLYQSLVDNKPYDQFVRELIKPTAESEGFINGIKWRGRVNASQVREVQFAQNVSQVFFGINMKCASCHDSFVDHWKLSDAYGLAAVIADRPLEIHRCDKATGEFATAKFMWPELGAIDGKLPKDERLAQLAALITQPDNGRFARTIANRVWQRLMGRGIVHPVDAMESEPADPALLEYLARYLVDNKYDLKKLMEHIATSRIYQAKSLALKEIPASRDYVFRGPLVKRMTAEQFLDALWQLGDGAGPGKAEAPVKLPDFAATAPKSQQFVRVSLVNADALMRSLGRPNREQVVTVRPDELTTLQALDLGNGAILADTLKRGAGKLLSRPNAATSPDALIDSLYQQALSRPPTADELALAREFLGEKPDAGGVADLLWALAMLPEFQLVR